MSTMIEIILCLALLWVIWTPYDEKMELLSDIGKAWRGESVQTEITEKDGETND